MEHTQHSRKTQGEYLHYYPVYFCHEVALFFFQTIKSCFYCVPKSIALSTSCPVCFFTQHFINIGQRYSPMLIETALTPQRELSVLKSFYFVSCLHCLSSFSFLHFLSFSLSTAELNVELSRPLKVNPTLAKLEQVKAYLKKVLPDHTWDTSSKPPSASSTPHSSPTKTLSRACLSHSEPHHQASALCKASSVRALALTFHKVSLHTAQIVVVMETEAHPAKPSVTVTVSAMTGNLNIKSGPRIEGE